MFGLLEKMRDAQQAGLLFWRIGRLLVCAVQQVVHADMMKVRQRAQHLGRQHPLAALIVCICPLGNAHSGADLGLRQVLVLPEGPDALKHVPSPATSIQKNKMFYLHFEQIVLKYAER